jgi:hypothetical protein
LTHLSPKALPPASVFYDDDLSARVARLYAEDFRHYGYSTDVPRAAEAQDGDRKVVGPAFPQAQL